MNQPESMLNAALAMTCVALYEQCRAFCTMSMNVSDSTRSICTLLERVSLRDKCGALEAIGVDAETLV